MAIAEAEPKKSEVAVTSAGVSDGMKEKVLNAGKSFADNKGYASSSTSTSVGTVKRYNLYDSIKGFRFEMPDGWNDEDIGLFVTCCWEKKDDFVKSNGDRTKIWADIAQSGAKQSRNPSLFTINSCLALAERIRYYVSKNSSIFLDNEAFVKFHSDVKGLLPHFSDNFDTKKVMENKCVRRKVKSKSVNEYASELLNNDSGLGDVIHDLALENAEAIRSGNRNVWTEMSNKLEQHLGLNTDVKTILESEKNKIISSVARMEEKGINKKTAFIECARGFVEVFDYINPKKIKVSDYLQPSVGSTVESVTQGKDKSSSKVKRPNYNPLSENSSVYKNITSYSVENDNDNDDEEEASQEGKRMKKSRMVKGRRPKSKSVENKLSSDVEDLNENQEVVVEPSSTTSFEEVADRQSSTNAREKKRKYLPSNEEMEKGVGNKNTSKRKEEKVSPRRIMPPRIARSKVISYSLNTRRASATKEISNSRRNVVGETESTSKSTQQQPYLLTVSKENDRELAKNSPSFRGFDTDSEETTIDFTERFKRTRGTKSASVSATNVTNPDTTTKDPDNKMTEGNVPFMKRVNRKRIMNKKPDTSSKQEVMGSKVRVVHADCTMKNLVVKLVDCNGSIDNPSHGNIMKLEKNNPFNGRIRLDRTKEVRLIEESAALAKDVVDSEYNPSSDSAKLVSDEHLSGLRNEMDGHRSMAAAASFINSNQLTKHHISPFFEFTKSINDGLRVSADSSEDIESVGHAKVAEFCNNKLQDNSVSSPYSTNAGGSSSLDCNQLPSTSTGNVNSTTPEKVALESALATLKKRRNELLTSQDSSLCVTTSEGFETSQFLTRIQDAPLPDWFGSFVADFKKHETWKIEQLFKMQREITDVEHRKVMLLEKILGSLVKD
ncbi:uncharacterized protein [Halyomorpha halys]|uniref:uncharacterized protein n=1 Tax=Halyomorpha halys TaxID=286706 RepID=UPI0006D50E57|nr:uncharacterized protein LOC106681272 [Halyomorpha halys]XP_014276995.1 uncharacterized protein LOC106681272 [Halyomorpha halys]XP_014276996.1 uncharacterized protein LOC106681272 [Halyomorpha halys]XP_014276997.1 uncharacterized protein LOC106681272 [Halyomorpha halys]